jgi:hypothetical protein
MCQRFRRSRGPTACSRPAAQNATRTGHPNVLSGKAGPAPWPTFTFLVTGNDEVGDHGWELGTQAALVPTIAKPAKVGQPATRIISFA